MSHINPWFPAAKLGIFIHWNAKCIENDVGQKIEGKQLDLQREWVEKHFTAKDWDAREWARTFKQWGGTYAVLTTKHHLGFALFDCDAAQFTSKKSAPAQKDIVAEYCEALREEGIKVGLYYSLPDWSHPKYVAKGNTGTGKLEKGDVRAALSRSEQANDWDGFIADMFAEVRHLCTAYGKIDLLWFDGDWEATAEEWRTPELVQMIESLQPGIVFNNRLRHANLGHYDTPETTYPIFQKSDPWEFCGTLGDNWDGIAANENVMSTAELHRLFCDMISNGGNLLMNVSPNGAGVIPAVQQKPMNELGCWLKEHAEAVYGTEGGLPLGLFNGASTRRKSVLYLFCYDVPQGEIVVKGIGSTIAKITHLVSGQELKHRFNRGRSNFGAKGWLWIYLPTECVEPLATVIKIEFENDVAEILSPDGTKRKWVGRPSFDEQSLYETRA